MELICKNEEKINLQAPKKSGRSWKILEIFEINTKTPTEHIGHTLSAELTESITASKQCSQIKSTSHKFRSTMSDCGVSQIAHTTVSF
jgi:hypothetical protein